MRSYPSPRYDRHHPPPALIVPVAHAALTAALLAYAALTRRRLASARREVAACFRLGLALGADLTGDRVEDRG